MNWTRINIEDPTTWPKLGQRVLLEYVYNNDFPEIATFIHPDQDYKFYINNSGKPFVASRDFDSNNICSFEEAFCWMPLPQLNEDQKREYMKDINRIANERSQKS